MNPDLQTVLALIARHFLTTAAGALAAHGYISSSATEQVVAGGVVLAGGAWSWWQKRGQAWLEAEVLRLAKLAAIYKKSAGPPSLTEAHQVMTEAKAATKTP